MNEILIKMQGYNIYFPYFDYDSVNQTAIRHNQLAGYTYSFRIFMEACNENI